MPERISSSLTFVYRAVVPPLIIGGFGIALVTAFRVSAEDGASPGGGVNVMAVLAWAAGSAFLLWLTGRLRSVFLLSDALLVSNLGRERRIPLDRIVGVTETLTTPKLIRVEVEEVPGQREAIVFVAPFEPRIPFSTHPVVLRLRSRAETARGKSRAPAAVSPSRPSER